MFKDFYNPELKRSTYFLIIMMVTVIMLLVLTVNQLFIHLKNEYVLTQAAVVGNLIEKYPKLQQELVPLITKGVTQEQQQRGLRVLKEYGYTQQLETFFLPEVKRWRKGALLVAVLFSCTLFVVFIFLNALQYRFVYRKMRELTYLMGDVLENKYDSPLPLGSEGEFSRLIDRFDQMRVAMKNNMLSLRKEKKFLVRLLSDMTHQLKTPLASLIVFTDILSEKKVSEEQQEMFLKNSKEQLLRVEWLIKTVLTLAKLDAGAIILRKEKQPLSETLYQSISLLKEKAQESGIQLILEPNDVVRVSHDRQWLSEAVMNIIENGIEHTPLGGYVKITMEDSFLYFKIKIQDNGEGIDEKELSKIFQRFYQGVNRKKGNTVGVGLSLSKTIVEAHGGYIEVESEKGKGSLFSITILK